VASVLAALMVAAFTLGASSRPAAAAVMPAAATGTYAALGDSFSAGVGSGRPDSGSSLCRRTSGAYPSLWAASRPGVRLTFLACSGARISTVRNQQVPQVPHDAGMITVTMGGNDVGFAAVVEICALASSDRSCTLSVGLAKVVAVTVVPVQLALTLRALKNQAPHARIVVLGYPRLFELGPCAGQVPSAGRRQSINAGTDLLDGALANVSRLFGVQFADVRSRFAGHGLCAPGGQSWITGPGRTDSYHPTSTGQAQGYLPALESASG
jgi:lysophospholipase L1-like esterase